VNARLAVSIVLAATFAAQPADRAAGWRDDLAVFSHALKSGQYAFATRNDVAAFDAEVASLQRDAGALTDADITLRLMKLVAGAHDGHSHVDLPLFKPFRRLPLTFEWYADGLGVTSAAPEFTDALGLRVSRIGSMTPAQLLAAAAPYIAHENEFALRSESPGYLTTLELLQAVGAADASGRVTLALVGSDGSPVEVTVTPGNPLKWSTVSAFEARHTPSDVLHRHPDQRYYWYEYLAGARAMYVQYNICRNDPKRPFAEFVADLLAAADREHAQRWILDLRRNNGGSDRVVKPLTNALAGRSAHQPVFVLIGGGTFSAAIEAAMDFKAKAHATLVGEPTGGRPNIFGDPKTVTLPNSQLKVQYSTSFVRHVDADLSAIDPDIRVSATLADVLGGRDPVLDAGLTRVSVTAGRRSYR
jgi:peptidase S41-like protein